MAVGSQLIGIATGVVTRKISMVGARQGLAQDQEDRAAGRPGLPRHAVGRGPHWAAASGVAVGVGRLVATKGAATAKMKLTGKVPEGMEGPARACAAAVGTSAPQGR